MSSNNNNIYQNLNRGKTKRSEIDNDPTDNNNEFISKISHNQNGEIQRNKFKILGPRGISEESYPKEDHEKYIRFVEKQNDDKSSIFNHNIPIKINPFTGKEIEVNQNQQKFEYKRTSLEAFKTKPDNPQIIESLENKGFSNPFGITFNLQCLKFTLVKFYFLFFQ